MRDDNVSGVTFVLVTPEAQPDSRRGEAARKHGTRIVRPGVFEQLIAYVQPASPVLVVQAAFLAANSYGEGARLEAL